MTGRIIRIISNLYSVECDNLIYECRARGKFRDMGLTPLVGDIVEFNENDKYILSIHERKNELSRPSVANIDKCIIVTTCKRPDFSSYLLDKMIVNIKLNDIEPIVVFSKYDLLTDDEKKTMDSIIEYYNRIGIKSFINHDIDNIQSYINGSTVALTGQTGAGKSTLINKFDNELNLLTDDISEALGRGKHTTRHVELYKVTNNYEYFIADTPGFSALDLVETEKENIKFMFDEFKNDECKFSDCRHINEKGCAVLEQLNNKEILESRYENYKKLVSE